MNKGALSAVGAYTIWGLLPLYWTALRAVPALEILTHRIVWALLVTLLLIVVSRRWQPVLAALRNPRALITAGAAALLLSANWFLYIWAVNAGHVVETSLGYFINPLVNVLIGVVLLHERLRVGQGAAVLLALGGVLYLTWAYGTLPWIALSLAFSFGIYGLLRKTAELDSLTGLTLETLLIGGPALIYLLILGSAGAGSFGHGTVSESLLLAGTGIVTAVPLLLFASGARRITMTTLGLLQYIAPTLQFILGVTVYREAVSPQRLIGFALVWAALAIYSIESLTASRRMRSARAAAQQP